MSETATVTLDVRYRDTTPLDAGNGLEIYYETDGQSGPNVVLLNNFYLIAPVWRTWMPTLSSDHRVTSYDLRNQGATSAGYSHVEWRDHVDDLLALLDGLGIEQTYLVGTSASTLLARDFALAHPDRVRGIVLQGPAFNPVTGRRRRAITRSWMRTLEHGGIAALWDHLYSQVFGDQAMEDGGSALYLGMRELFTSVHSATPLMINLASSLAAPDDPALLSALSCPTLLVIGENDFVWTRTAAEATADLVPDSELLFLPAVGHLPFMEATEAVETAIRAFTARVEAADAR
ncbi:alpha/beta fold hydrolase [Nocardia sp. NPDC059239]|uniref:alpha/beta fold hydrolase n=1 Tax=unclassified Nocardia TaxID=2637762 RepID=UPI0036BD2619